MKIIRQLVLIFLSFTIISSCVKEKEKLQATAIMTDKTSLEFAIDEDLTLALTVYADAPWTVDCPDWISVDPSTGAAGEILVSVTASPNIREELPDRPRKDVIIFRGQNMYADASVDVLQNGDKYRDLVEGTLAEAFTQNEETFVGVKDVQVVALTSNGYIVKDETAISYIQGTQEVQIGNKGSVYAYVSRLNNLPSLNKADKVVMSENAEVDYTGIKDITSTLQSYVPEQVELVSIKGKFASNKIELYYEEGQERPIEPDSVKVEILNPHSSLNASELDGWLVEAKGYVFGNISNVLYLVPISIEGIKALEKIYFADDFSWLSPWSKVDSVGENDQSTSVDNVWKFTDSKSFFDKFNEIGYQYLYGTIGDSEFKSGPAQEANPSVGKDGSMYICKDYLKFGQTSYNGALRLPALSSIEGVVNIKIDFDWCWQLTGSKNPDIMTLNVESNVGKFEQTGLALSQELESEQSQEAESSDLDWQHVSVILTEATAETVLTIRPTNPDPSKSNPVRNQNRWYLDNIKVVKYEGSVSVAEPTEADMTITMDNSITFDASQAEPISFTLVSDQEITLTAGADWMYFIGADDSHVSTLTIPAGASTVVSVGCEENTESEARETLITIESGLTKETIPVTQVSPGVNLEPFISIVDGNSYETNYEAKDLEFQIQSNVDYEIETDANWITIVPAAKALVEIQTLTLQISENEGSGPRTGIVRVYNETLNLESLLTIVQNEYVLTLATFPFPYDTGFTGEGDGAGVKWNLTEGWLLSEDGNSKLSSHIADGTSLAFTYKYEASGDSGLTKDHVRVLATGMQKGGYWLFEVPVKDMPAGTYNIKYKHSASATGPNYFLMEVSVDGQNWLSAGAQTTTETYKDGTGGREVTWTYALNKGGVNGANVACDVDVDYSAPALSGENKLYIRAKIADDMAYGATKALGAKGTNRIWGPCEVTFGN